MPDISKINGVAIANIPKLNGRTLANGDKVMGISREVASSTIFSTTFDDDTGSSDASTTMPSGWARSYNSGWTIYGSTTAISSTRTDRFWLTGHGTTPSSYTGCGGGMDNGVDATSGEWSNGSSQRYLYYEASTPASSTSANVRAMVRTGALDFSGFTTITMTFWFHMYGKPNSNTGGGTDRMGKFGIAATTSTTDASDSNEAGSGLGFTSDDNGGCTMTYWTAHDGSSTASGTRIDGTQQGTGHTTALATNNHWRKATINLSGAAGESSVYLFFLVITDAASSSWGSDVCIENIKIVGS